MLTAPVPPGVAMTEVFKRHRLILQHPVSDLGPEAGIAGEAGGIGGLDFFGNCVVVVEYVLVGDELALLIVKRTDRRIDDDVRAVLGDILLGHRNDGEDGIFNRLQIGGLFHKDIGIIFFPY